MRARAPGLLLLAFVAVCASGCEETPAIPVRLSTGPRVIGQAPSGTFTAPLRFVFANVVSPERSAIPHERFARYLAGRLGRPVEVVRRRTDIELNELLRRGNAQAGLVSSGAYAVGREEFGLALVSVPVVGGRATSRSCVLVRRRSGHALFTDLKGAVFAFTDPLSNGGYRYVAAAVRGLGTTVDRFFGRTLFTYSHDSSVQAVRDGIADGCVVDSTMWDVIVRQTPSIGDEIVVIDRSGEFPNDPVAVSPRAPPGLADRLAGVLDGMPGDPVGREVLEPLGITRFVTLPDRAYDPIAAGWRELGVIATGDGPPGSAAGTGNGGDR